MNGNQRDDDFFGRANQGSLYAQQQQQQHPYARFGGGGGGTSSGGYSLSKPRNDRGSTANANQPALGVTPLGKQQSHPFHRPYGPEDTFASSSGKSHAAPSEGPSFASTSTTSLPGALGIHHAGSTSISGPSSSTLGGYSPFGGFQAASSGGPNTSPAGTRRPSIPSSASRSSQSSQSLSSLSLGYGYGVGGPSAGSGSGALGLNSSNNSSRDFLVPIGATGARQKLSILSPSQRRLASTSTSGAAGTSGSATAAASNRNSRSVQPASCRQEERRPSVATTASDASGERQQQRAAQQLPPTQQPPLIPATSPRRDSNTSGSDATAYPSVNASASDLAPRRAAVPPQVPAPQASTPPRPVRSTHRGTSISSASPPTSMSPLPSGSSSSMASLTQPSEPESPAAPLRTAKHHQRQASQVAEPESRRGAQTDAQQRVDKRQQQHSTRAISEDQQGPTTRTLAASTPRAPGQPQPAPVPSSDALPDLSRVSTPTQASVIARQWRQESSSGGGSSSSSSDRNTRSHDSRKDNFLESFESSADSELQRQANKHSVDAAAASRSQRQPHQSSSSSSAASSSTTTAPGLSSSSSLPIGLGSFDSSDSIGTTSSSSNRRKDAIKGKFTKILSAGGGGSSGGAGKGSAACPAPSPSAATATPSTADRDGGFSETSLASRYRDAVSRGGMGMTASRSMGDISVGATQARGPRRSESGNSLAGSGTGGAQQPVKIASIAEDSTGAPRATISAYRRPSHAADDQSPTLPSETPARWRQVKRGSDQADDSPLPAAQTAPDSPDLKLKLGDWGEDLGTLLPSYMHGTFERGGTAAAAADTDKAGAGRALPALPQSAAASARNDLDNEREASTTTAAATTSSSSSVGVKPGSPPRPLPPQPDVYTLGRLNGSTDTAPALPSKPASSASASGTGQATNINPKTYVPKGALSHNRKGSIVSAGRNSSNTGPASTNRNAAAATRPPNGISEDQFGLSDDEDDFVTPLDSGTTLPSSAWVEVENALATFRGQSDLPVDKGVLIRNVLLPFLALEAETPNLEVNDGKFRSARARRALFFDWIAHLLIELQHVQTSADRGAILESIACIIESRNLSVSPLANDPKDESKFASTFGHILLYAIGELNKKGVYQNTLIFSGRLLAIAFFRVDGVASKLLRALPINRFAMERVAAEAQWSKRAPKNYKAFVARFPPSLRDFCFQDARSYLRALDAQSTAGDELESDRFLVRQPEVEVEVEMSGNWLRRWQSDDSELFFSFCRSYHRQLAGLLTSTRALQGVAKRFFGGPGYAHLATCIHLKCLSLVNRVILSVTTLSSQKNFNPGETANVLSGSTAGKPRHLEAANRRCTAIVVDIVRAPNNQTFLPILGTHIKCLVKRTSLYDVQSVFCLLDWLDGVLGHMDAVELPIETLVDVDFLIDMIRLLLNNADHALALMRTIAFCYSNFAVLISTVEHRKKFCEGILLDRPVFHKLFLSWSFTIRAYFLHLLVFRLARLKDFPNPPGDEDGKSSVEIVKLFDGRLDEIRKRHEELSPPSSNDDSDDKDGGDGNSNNNHDGKSQDGDASSTYSRIKSSRTSFVSTIRHTPSIHQTEQAPTMTKAERVLGIGMPDPLLVAKQASEPKTQSRAAKWLRALGGKGGARNKHGGSGRNSSSSGSGSGGGSSVDSALASPPMLDSPNISNRPRFQRKPYASDFDFDDGDQDDDDDDDDEAGGDGDDGDEDDGMATKSAAANGRAPRPIKKESEYEFDFEPRGHHNDHITPDATFDLQTPPSPITGTSRGSTGSGSSPHISRALSRRTSILPGPAAELVEGGGGDDSDQRGADRHAASKAAIAATKTNSTEGYAPSLHIYATQGLREWEAVLAEHDEFFATMADQSDPPAVPRLPVQWPAMWSD